MKHAIILTLALVATGCNPPESELRQLICMKDNAEVYRSPVVDRFDVDGPGYNRGNRWQMGAETYNPEPGSVCTLYRVDKEQ